MKKTKLRWALALMALALPTAAWAQLTGTATLSTGQNFSFDSAKVVTSGGDLQFTGTSLTFVGTAKGGNLGSYGFTGSTAFSTLTATELQALASLASAAPIPSSSLTAGTASGSIVALETNGGNAAAMLVTALSSSSITFQYITFTSGSTGGGGGGPSGPTVTDIVNNSSLIPMNGFTNSGIAPSTLFVIHGSNMASATTVTSLQDSSQPGGLPTTLNGAQVTISAGGKTWNPGLYYAEATQIAGVLPAAVPVGSATLTVSYNNGTSSPVTLQVVPSAYGIDSYSGNLAVAQDALTYQLLNYTNSGKPGQIIILWGSGLGADSADSDVSYTSTPHAINTQTQVYIGGVQAANVAYVGASVYPGVDIIQLTLPSGVPNGCYVPIVVVTGNSVDSNFPTIPFMDNGGVCSDPYTGLNGTQINNLTGNSTTRTGTVFVGQETSPGTNGGAATTQDYAFADFEKVSGTSSISGSGTVSLGTCALSQTVTTTGSTPTVTGLNAGTITVTGPSGGPVTLQSFPQVAGSYEAELASGAIPTSGGSFAFNGSGGSDVGSFTATVNFPNPILSWTNQSAAATVTRGSGLTYQWSGGASGTYVIVSGTSISGTASGSYTCIFPQSAGQGTVPPYILNGLPAGTGTSGIENTTAFTSFSASGIDFGYAVGFVSVQVNSVYK